MKSCLRDQFPALALVSVIFAAAGCSEDEPILSVDPPEVDAAEQVKLDAAPLRPDAAAPSPDLSATDGESPDALAADGPAADLAPEPPDARTCGGVGQAPCPGARCADGLCLSANRCIAPGMACAENAGLCNANGSCTRDNQTCGGNNQVCCGIGQEPQGAYCSAPGTDCFGNGQNRTCRSCGGPGEPCCGEPGSCAQGMCMGQGNNRVCP